MQVPIHRPIILAVVVAGWHKIVLGCGWMHHITSLAAPVIYLQVSFAAQNLIHKSSAGHGILATISTMVFRYYLRVVIRDHQYNEVSGPVLQFGIDIIRGDNKQS